MAPRIRKNDIVQIIAGKDRGKKGKALQVLPQSGMIIVEGVNMMAKNVRPKRMGEKGQVVRYNAPMNASNVLIFCGKCNKGVRVGMQVSADGKRQRICRKCKQVI
ncbi:MAG: 50S ribosomal protein L24 [Patescibacteria group bacterium]|nr:50S ribosomal protein L24 [Patescibacteria group bacterium]MDD5715364.1 50S ribosomal protein L24 [Patescibacteria group bacterium]